VHQYFLAWLIVLSIKVTQNALHVNIHKLNFIILIIKHLTLELLMVGNESIQLYQFPISHYCEKVRWALDFKGLPYQKVNYLPGLHARKNKKLAKFSSVPILKHKDAVIQGSTQIIDYLEAEFPGKPLNFSDKQLNQAANEWERYADENIGPHVRRIMYHELLNHPSIVIPLFSHQGPWYSGLYFKLTYPKLTQVMRKLMNINDESVIESKEILQNSLSKLNQYLSITPSDITTDNQLSRNYLVGDQFSRADLSVSALLAPLFSPKEYGLNWPDTFPPEIQSLIESYAPHMTYAKHCYASSRTKSK
jgi:glutathione S-transferase